MATGIIIIGAGIALLLAAIAATFVVRSGQRKEQSKLFENLKKEYWI